MFLTGGVCKVVMTHAISLVAVSECVLLVRGVNFFCMLSPGI